MKSWTIFLTPLNAVRIRADKCESMCGNVLAFWADDRIVAQFNLHMGYVEDPADEKNLNNVLTLVPASKPPETAA